MNIAFQLFQIQEVDTSIDNYNKRIAEIDDQLTNNKVIEKSEALVEVTKELLIKKSNKFKELNDEIEKKKIKKSQSQSSLYSGKVQNPKELEDLQKEISSLTQIITTLEESLMNALIDLDNVENDFENFKGSLSAARSQYATEKSMLIAEKEGLTQKVNGALKKRSPIIAQVDSNHQQLYESLRKKKRGLAVTLIREGCCGACGATLTAGQRQTARSSSKLFICPTCGRIIYGSS